MKKQFLVLSIAGISLLFIASDTYDINSNGAPIASTGAPNETTCARAGCHSGSNVNSGAGVLDVNYTNSIASYEPGKTYTLTVSLSQQTINRFGFEMTVLKNSDSTNAGTFKIIDTVRTQILDGLNQYTGRKYVTYKYPGTLPYASNLGQWMFEWEAPPVDEGAITFYTAGVSANDDGTDGGDLVYTKALTVQPQASGINEQSDASDLSVFPVPNAGTFHISVPIAIGIGVQASDIAIYNLKGEKVYSSIFKGRSLTISLDVPDGVYFLHLRTENRIANKKIIIAK